VSAREEGGTGLVFNFNISSKENRKRKLPSRKVARDVKFFIKNTTRGTRVEIFNKTRRVPNFTSLATDLPSLCFSWFLVLYPSPFLE
jgi:hypothetical protein